MRLRCIWIRAVLGLIVILGPAPTLPLTAAAQDTACLKQIQTQVPQDGEITLLTKSKTPIKGRLKKVDMDRRLLTLEVFHPQSSRFLQENVPGDNIKTIQFHQQSRDWRIPIIAAAALGGAALALGLGFDSFEDIDDENLWVGMTAIGVTVGFVGGLLMAPARMSVHTIECRNDQQTVN